MFLSAVKCPEGLLENFARPAGGPGWPATDMNQKKEEVRNQARAYWKEFLANPVLLRRLQDSFLGFLESRSKEKKDSICLAFKATASEFNVLELLKEQGWSVALPLVRPGYRLSFHLYLDRGRPILDLEKGAYGIMEPPSDSPSIQPSSEDVLIVPTMAINAEGYRLGKGGGFYDRLLDIEEFQRMDKWAALPEHLLNAPFEGEDHDLRLNRIITEERIVAYP